MEIKTLWRRCTKLGRRLLKKITQGQNLFQSSEKITFHQTSQWNPKMKNGDLSGCLKTITATERLIGRTLRYKGKIPCYKCNEFDDYYMCPEYYKHEGCPIVEQNITIRSICYDKGLCIINDGEIKLNLDNLSGIELEEAETPSKNY